MTFLQAETPQGMVAAPRRKLLSLQAGRGIAAVMVVLDHVGGFMSHQPNLWQVPAPGRWLEPLGFGVGFFFVLSGVVILMAHWDDLGVPRKASRFLSKRFLRIYPLYWIFLSITVARQMFHSDDPAQYRDPLVVLSNYLLIHLKGTLANLAPAWTMFHEVLFYGFFVILILNRRVGAVLFSAWIGGCFFFMRSDAVLYSANSWWAVFFSPLHLLFGFGLLVGWLLQRRGVTCPLWPLVLGCVMIAGSITLAGMTILSPLQVTLIAGAGASLAIWSATERERGGKLSVPRWLEFLGEISYSLYLSHYMILSAIARTGYKLDQRLHLPLVVWGVMMFAASIVAATLTNLLLERPIARWLNRGKVPVSVGNAAEPGNFSKAA